MTIYRLNMSETEIFDIIMKEDDMEELVNAIKVAIADHYSLYHKAHGYHWNVEGSDFEEYHSLFGKIYEDTIDVIDDMGENIRKLGAYAPFKMSRFMELTTVPETEVSSDCNSMTVDLLAATEMVIVSNMAAYRAAEAAGEVGISNFHQDRDGMLKKWRWQLRASCC